MATSSVSQSLIEDWKYLAEGGSTIVFAYIGPAHYIISNKVLRLRKVKHQTTGTTEDALAPPLIDFDDPAIAFQETVIRRLIPDELLPLLEVVSVDRNWVQCLAEAAEAHRPEARRLVDRIDLDRGTAVVADNLIGGAGLAVEVKASLLLYAVFPSHPVALSQSGVFFRVRTTSLLLLALSRRALADSACTHT